MRVVEGELMFDDKRPNIRVRGSELWVTIEIGWLNIYLNPEQAERLENGLKEVREWQKPRS